MLAVYIRTARGRAMAAYAYCKRRASELVSRALTAGRALRRNASAVIGTGRRGLGRAVAAVRSEKPRERLMAAGAFAGLALMMAASFDFLLGGGPNWNPGAEAAPYRADSYLKLSALPEIPYTPPVEINAAPEEPLGQAKVTPVRYTAPAGVLLGGPLPGDELEAPAAIVYAHEGPAPFGEY